MVAKGKLTRETSQTVNSEAVATEKKRRPQHSQCEFARDGLCTNRASVMYGMMREPEAPVCSSFRKRDT